jgi:hypothetical protein
MSVYAFMKDDVYLYDKFQHVLIPKKEGDYRQLISNTQIEILDAPVDLLIVEKPGVFTSREVWMDAGVIAQNINLFCAGIGLQTVTRIDMNNSAIINLLGFDDNLFLTVNNPVRYFPA